MLQVVLELVDLDSHLLLLCVLKVDLFVVGLQLLVVLRVVLLELRFLLFQLDAGCCELLPQLLDVNCTHREVASHRQIRLRVKLLGRELDLDGADSGLDLGVLVLEPRYLLLREVLELVEFLLQLILLRFDVPHAHLRV